MELLSSLVIYNQEVVKHSTKLYFYWVFGGDNLQEYCEKCGFIKEQCECDDYGVRKVKMFIGTINEPLETLVNNWLLEHDDVEIISFQYNQLSVCILYRE